MRWNTDHPAKSPGRVTIQLYLDHTVRGVVDQHRVIRVAVGRGRRDYRQKRFGCDRSGTGFGGGSCLSGQRGGNRRPNRAPRCGRWSGSRSSGSGRGGGHRGNRGTGCSVGGSRRGSHRGARYRCRFAGGGRGYRSRKRRHGDVGVDPVNQRRARQKALQRYQRDPIATGGS